MRSVVRPHYAPLDLREVYPTNGVQWEMVVGTGVKTLRAVHEQESGKPIYAYENGDGTVPMDSAAMGNVQPASVHYVCFAVHGEMAGARQVTRVISAYLLRGDPVKGRAAPARSPTRQGADRGDPPPAPNLLGGEQQGEQGDGMRGKFWVVVIVALVASLVRVPIGPTAAAAPPPGTPLDDVAGCDPIDPAACLLPFPNDYYTVEDPTTDTGRRLNLSPLAMPQNIAGKPIDPTEWNRNDGFSPGAMILTMVPGLDLVASGAPTIDRPELSLKRKSPIQVIDADTGKRHLVWAELDANATGDDDRTVIVRPAVNFAEGHRYVVALKNLKDASGTELVAGEAFAAYRDGTAAADDPRTAEMNEIFSIVEGAGVDRKELFLAWDFTVASERNLAERMLHIRDDAFASLGDTDLGDLVVEGAAPDFTVDLVTDFSPEESAEIARRVEGTFTVPLYLTEPGADCFVIPQVLRDLSGDIPENGCVPTLGDRFNYTGSTDGLPTRLGGVATMEADYICNVPRSAANEPARPSLYGHGLLGSNGEVGAGNVRAMSNEHNMMFCATDWIGMATEDVPNVAAILTDMSHFPSLSDRAQQGMLNFLFLGRLMIHPDGFVANPAFRGANDEPLIDTDELFYDGNSQGGIMGGALTAVAPDFTRAVLGVPGMNYSTLLNRSVDWDTYSVVAYAAYPDKVDQQLMFALIQMLWDRAEANGYAHHMTDDPYPNTPEHQVLLHEAFGDHQVANVTTEVEARTIGARIYTPALADGRHYDASPFFGIERIARRFLQGFDRYRGSAFVIWDSGTPTPPAANLPNDAGDDPHGDPRAQVSARLQKSFFLMERGYFVDVCSGTPCLTQ